MKFSLLFLSLLVLSSFADARVKHAFAIPETTAQALQRDLHASHLLSYEKAGQRISKYLRGEFIRLLDSDDELNFAEKLETAYQDKIKPGRMEKMSLEPDTRAGFFISDIHRALELRQKYQEAFREDPEIRKRLQNVLIGSLHLIDVQIRSEMDATVEELLRVRQFLLSQGTFITRGATELTTDDIWWDWMWLRGHEYASDLVLLHMQKMALIGQQSNSLWKERLRRERIAVAIFALKNNAQPVLGRDKAAVVSLNITNEAMRLAGDNAQEGVKKQLKLYLFRGLQATGQTYEASQIKKELAGDLFLAKGAQIAASTAEPWHRSDLNIFAKFWLSLGQLIRGTIIFLTYGVGFLFVATPIETLLVLFAILILAKQGEHHFQMPRRSISALAMENKLLARDGWRRLPQFAMALVRFTREGLSLAWRMFVASYSAERVPFYSKVAASLLLFGIGLYFNSARTLVEGVVAQMTM